MGIWKEIERGTLMAVALVGVAGCTATLRGPELGPLYDRAAQHHGPDRNPVIVIPGVLGSKLVDSESGRMVWGAFAGSYANPETPDGARLVALPMREGAALGELRDAVDPNGVLDRVKVELLGLPIELNAYLRILGTLGIGGYRDELLGKAGAIDYGDDHYTCFQFDYDWRRDNVENARRLHDFILIKRAYVQRKLEERFGVADAPVKFDIVAHSMGGLVARYFLRYGAADLPADGSVPPVTWEGARHVERVILVGTPNAGSAQAIMDLVQGRRFGFILPRFEPGVLGTMPAIYQLLPRTRHATVVDAADPGRRLDIFDAGLWERHGWGLAAPDQDRVLRSLLPEVTDPGDRRRIALAHQRLCLERARQLAAALDQPASPPPGISLYLVAADAMDTLAVVAVDSNDGAVEKLEWWPGDGTVTRSSALLDERQGGAWSPALVSPIAWSQVVFLFADHLGMTEDPAFSDNVLYLLLEDPRR